MNFLRSLWRFRALLREHAVMAERLAALRAVVVSKGGRVQNLAELEGLVDDALLLHDVIAGRKPLAQLFDGIHAVFGGEVYQSLLDQARVYLAAVGSTRTRDADTGGEATGRASDGRPGRFLN